MGPVVDVNDSTMGFLFAVDGGPPAWPHIVCDGTATAERRGWAWHDDQRKRKCFASSVVSVPLPADIVSAAIDGRALPGIDRLLAVAAVHEEARGTFRKLFRSPCRECGADHLKRASRCVLAIKLIHQDAWPVLRRAHVPERWLSEPRLFLRGEVAPPMDKEEVSRLIAESDPPAAARVRFLYYRRRSIPAYDGDPDRTRIAQIAFATQFLLKKRMG